MSHRRTKQHKQQHQSQQVLLNHNSNIGGGEVGQSAEIRVNQRSICEILDAARRHDTVEFLPAILPPVDIWSVMNSSSSSSSTDDHSSSTSSSASSSFSSASSNKPRSFQEERQQQQQQQQQQFPRGTFSPPADAQQQEELNNFRGLLYSYFYNRIEGERNSIADLRADKDRSDRFEHFIQGVETSQMLQEQEFMNGGASSGSSRRSHVSRNINNSFADNRVNFSNGMPIRGKNSSSYAFEQQQRQQNIPQRQQQQHHHRQNSAGGAGGGGAGGTGGAGGGGAGRRRGRSPSSQ
jgi:hypothetical protein